MALDDSGMLVGWIGGIFQYDGHVCEVQSLGVKEEYRGQGVGRALIEDLEVPIG